MPIELYIAAIGVSATLAGCGKTGTDQALLGAAAGAGLAALESSESQAQALGVSMSPTYFIGTEPFQGRQHLPLLAARLKL